MELRIGLAQVAPRLGDLDANLELVARRIGDAATEGAQLTIFPELALTGYLLSDLVPEVAMRRDDARLLGIGRVAPGMLVAVGFVEETDDHRFCNSAALLRDGELHRPAPQGLPADLRPVRRGALHAPGGADQDGRRRSAVRTHRPVGVRGLLACLRSPCSRRSTVRSCS